MSLKITLYNPTERPGDWYRGAPWLHGRLFCGLLRSALHMRRAVEKRRIRIVIGRCNARPRRQNRRVVEENKPPQHSAKR